MKKITTVEEANDLLIAIRKNELLFISRGKNAQTLADLSITARMRQEIIDSLQAEDYCNGPDPDETYPSKFVAVFGKMHRGEELYIKFSFGLDDTPVVCLSFHKAEWPMVYQFK